MQTLHSDNNYRIIDGFKIETGFVTHPTEEVRQKLLGTVDAMCASSPEDIRKYLNKRLQAEEPDNFNQYLETGIEYAMAWWWEHEELDLHPYAAMACAFVLYDEMNALTRHGDGKAWYGLQCAIHDEATRRNDLYQEE